MSFDPKNLVPASTIDAFVKGGPRTTKQVALANIDKMSELFKDAKAEGRRTFEVKGDATKFTLRVNNTALDLEVFVNGKASSAKEVSVPTAMFGDALAHYRAQIEAGNYDAPLKALDGKREARTVKMRSTRAANKAEKDKPAS